MDYIKAFLEENWEPLESKLTELIDEDLRPTIHLSKTPSTPSESFELFFTTDLQEEIINRTNLNFEAKTCKKSKRDLIWKPLDSVEFKKFIGIMLMMGIDAKPEIEMHWQTHKMWSSDLIQQTMSRDKFLLISSYLDLGEKKNSDPFARTKKISEAIQAASLQIYRPRPNLAIDESMIGFQGKHSLKVYMPMKPTKWGFKAFLLCESPTGYCLKHKFFSGCGKAEFKTFNLCLELASGFEHQNYHIFIDNYYTSFELLEEFHNRGIACTGTLKKNKTSFVDIEKIEEKLGDAKFFRKNNITMCLLKGKKVVKMASNRFSSEYVVKNKKNFNSVLVSMPLMMAKYRESMIGVDCFDKRLQYYAYSHRFQKWWKYIFVYLLEMAINNSYFVFLECNKLAKKMSYVEYRIQLIKELTMFDEKNKQIIKDFETRQLSHKMLRLDKPKKCRYCYVVDKKKSNTMYECSVCEVPLHGKHFNIWHNLN